MTETPTASFKLGKAGRMALDGRLSVRTRFTTDCPLIAL